MGSCPQCGSIGVVATAVDQWTKRRRGLAVLRWWRAPCRRALCDDHLVLHFHLSRLTWTLENKHNLRVYAKDFPKPEQIDKTENYRIAGDLSKRFAVRRPFSMSERIILSARCSFSFLSFLRRQPRVNAVMVSLLFLRAC